MVKRFRMGPAKKDLILFISSLGVEKFTIDDLISRGRKEPSLARRLVNMTEQGLLKKEGHLYLLTDTFHVFIPQIKKGIEEKKQKDKEKLVPKDDDYVFQIDSRLSRNKKKIKELDAEIKKLKYRLKDLKKEKDDLEMDDIYFETIKKNLEKDRETTIAIMQGTKRFYK